MLSPVGSGSPVPVSFLGYVCHMRARQSTGEEVEEAPSQGCGMPEQPTGSPRLVCPSLSFLPLAVRVSYSCRLMAPPLAPLMVGSAQTDGAIVVT